MRKIMLLVFILFVAVAMENDVFAQQVKQSDFVGSSTCLGCHESGTTNTRAIPRADFESSFHSKKLRVAATGSLIPALQPGRV